jgi:hypothetical protein
MLQYHFLHAIRAKGNICMPTLKDIEKPYTFIRQQIINVHILWQDYNGIFAAGEDTLNVLRKTAPGFFGRLQWMLIDEIVLIITRILTDPAESPRKKGKLEKEENFCLKYLAGRILAPEDKEFRAQLEKDVDSARVQAKPIKNVRDKVISHNDLKTIQKPESLSKIDANYIENALRSIREIMNKIESCCGLGLTVFDPPVPFIDPGLSYQPLIAFLTASEKHFREGWKEKRASKCLTIVI